LKNQRARAETVAEVVLRWLPVVIDQLGPDTFDLEAASPRASRLSAAAGEPSAVLEDKPSARQASLRPM
jgi:hypothetical protein